MPEDRTLCTFIPTYLLERLQQTDDEHGTRCAAQTLAHDRGLREVRRTATVPTPPAVPAAWEIHDAKNTQALPGEKVRAAGEPASGDPAVDEAGAGIQATLDLLRTDFDRNSYDGEGAGVLGTVHYGQDYDNAFWNGTQLVFGDGDGTVFGRFTEPVDVLAHELTHAVTEKTANLTYQGQSGALNESISDAVGACVKQTVLQQSAEDADWLVGEGIFLPGVQGTALRSMKAPGTAYDDPRLGKDPQVASMADYDETTEDDGGVHINSGIPNRAFYLAATAIGGRTAQGAGRIWYAALTSGIAPDADFATFARATVAAAGEHADVVEQAWTTVGVLGVVAPAPTPDTAAPAPRALEVVRTGGIAGISRTGRLDLDDGSPRAQEAQQLLARVDLRGATAPSAPRPDRFRYEFRSPDGTAVLAEQDLTGDLHRLAALALDDE